MQPKIPDNIIVMVAFSMMLHMGAMVWWFSRPVQAPQITGMPTVTVDLIALTPPAPEPIVQSAPELAAEPELLRDDEMAVQIKVIKKKPPEKKQQRQPSVEQLTPVTPAPVAPTPNLAPVIAARHDAGYLNNQDPVYPPLSRRLAEEGEVLLRVQVSAEGSVLAVELKKSSGFERLDEAARKAVTTWHFVPAHQGDTALISTVVVPIHFSLKK